MVILTNVDIYNKETCCKIRVMKGKRVFVDLFGMEHFRRHFPKAFTARYKVEIELFLNYTQR